MKLKSLRMLRAALPFYLALPALLLAGGSEALAQEPALSGAALYRDLRIYSGFGVHRYGSAGERGALDWIAKALAAEGFDVEKQPLQMDRQVTVDKAQVTLGGKTIEAFPHWWPPAQEGTITLEAALKPDAQSAGAIAWLHLPYERGAYMNAQRRKKIMEVAAHKPRAILLTIDNPAGSIFTYNVTQTEAAWPVPVIIVPARLDGELEAARQRGDKVKIDLSAHTEHQVASNNVIARLDNGASKTVVVSTPVSSWFTSSCERGPGIALFLAMARHVAHANRSLNYVFVATVGHEIGHGGMEQFIHTEAPPPDQVKAWLHLGASLACYGWQHEARSAQWTRMPGADPALRALLASESMQAEAARAFAEVPAVPYFGARSGIGELRDVRAAGYVNYLGMAGLHRFFHTPLDRPEQSSPPLLEPLAVAFARVLNDLALN